MKMQPSRRRAAPSGPPRRQAAPAPAGTRPRWLLGLTVLVPLGAVALGGGTERWSQGLVLFGLGTLLLAAPPRASLGKGLNLIFLALVMLAGTAFLPARWLPWPAWRSALTDDLSVTLPATVSPQPWTSAEGLVLLVAGLSWVYLLGTVRWTPWERRRVGAWFAGGVAVLAALFLVLFKAGVTVPFWLSARGFGPFPNRNQTANFLAVGALPVLACAHAAWRAERRAVALGWVAAWLVVAGAVFNSFSRGGVLMLFAGSLLYLGAETLRANRRIAQDAPGKIGVAAVRSWRRGALVASLCLGLASTFLFFGNETLARFQPGTNMMENNVASDALRFHIQADAVRMIAAAPWYGVGLDNFDDVFALFRRQSVAPLRVFHPESDWLWLTAELGWPSLLLALAACVLLARRLNLPKHGAERPLRTAAALGLAMFAAHGLVEVSGHRLGTALSALFLLGLAMPGPGDDSASGDAEVAVNRQGRVFTGGFQLLGGLFLVVGTLWLVEARGWLTLPGAQGVAKLKAQTLSLGNTREYSAAQATATRALAWAPLDWRLHYMRGGAGVFLRQDLEGTLADFRRARYLEPCYAGVPLHEAELWANVGQSPQAVSALLEACRRAPEHADDFVRDVYGIGASRQDFFEFLSAAVRRDPALQLALLEQLEQPRNTRLIQSVLATDPDLNRLDAAQKRRFLRAWLDHNEGAGLAAEVAAHPAWQPPGWRSWAEGRARESDTDAQRDACGIVARYIKPLVVPTAAPGNGRSADELQSAANATPADPVNALVLYQLQSTAGDEPGVLATLKRITDQPDCPAYFFGLLGQHAASAEDWKTSWEAWRRYLELTKEGLPKAAK